MEQYNWDDLTVLREKDTEEYVPSLEEVIEYAEYIGLQLPEDEELLYIARQGINARLPDQWEACQSPTGDMLYRNKITKEIQQQHPLDDIYREKIAYIKGQNLQNQYFDVQFDLNQENQVLPAIEEDRNQLTDSGKSQSQQKIEANFVPYQNKNYQNYLSNSKSNTLSKKIDSHISSSQINNSALNRNISSQKNQNSNYASKMLSSAQNILQKGFISSQFNSKSANIAKNNIGLGMYEQIDQIKQFQPHQFSKRLSIHKSLTGNSSSQIDKKNQNIKIKNIQRQLQSLEKEEQLKLEILSQLKNANILKIQLIKEKIKNKMGKSKHYHKHKNHKKYNSKADHMQINQSQIHNEFQQGFQPIQDKNKRQINKQIEMTHYNFSDFLF